MLENIINFVNGAFERASNRENLEHFEKAVYWVKQLMPDADKAMCIAAYGHDISRAFRKTNTKETFKDREFNDPEILADHQEEGARIICELLRERQYDESSTQRVYNMIRHHEEGGDKESDVVMDADSLSYFETNVFKHVTRLVKSLGKEKVRRKVDWMYHRMSSEDVKQIAKPKYDAAIKILDAK